MWITKFFHTKLHGPSQGIFVGCIALKVMLKTLINVVFTYIKCQNIHSTNATCAFNSWLQVCIWFGDLVFNQFMTSSEDLCHWEKSQIYQNFFGWVWATFIEIFLWIISYFEKDIIYRNDILHDLFIYYKQCDQM